MANHNMVEELESEKRVVPLPMSNGSAQGEMQLSPESVAEIAKLKEEITKLQQHSLNTYVMGVNDAAKLIENWGILTPHSGLKEIVARLLQAVRGLVPPVINEEKKAEEKQ